ncbi:APC family permease [Streptomyces sp. NPDC057486]|uniref:APC family permease n=1 Tax=Streptomyces sp. NPDC057486 TaxID=3346145 RepID=UPI00368BC411
MAPAGRAAPRTCRAVRQAVREGAIAVPVAGERVAVAMGRDGMLPPVFRKVGAGSGTPVGNTLIVCAFVGLLAAFVPLGWLVDLTSMGALVAFAVVSVGVIVLRVREPQLPRGFKVPGYPVVLALSLLFCGYLIWNLPSDTFVLFAGWLTLALLVYFCYGRRHSKLARAEAIITPLEPSRTA